MNGGGGRDDSEGGGIEEGRDGGGGIDGGRGGGIDGGRGADIDGGRGGGTDGGRDGGIDVCRGGGIDGWRDGASAKPAWLARAEGRVEMRIDDVEPRSPSSPAAATLLERAPQERHEIARGRDASERALAQAGRDDVTDDGRYERRKRGLVAKDGRRGGRAAAAERRSADHHLVEHAAERPDVAPLVGQPVLDLLGRQIRRSPDHLAGAGEHVAVAHVGAPLGDAEVHEDDPPVGRQEQVGGLEIPVDDPRPVRGDQRLGGLDRIADGGLRAHGASLGDDPLEIEAVHVVHGNPGHVLVLARAAHAHDARMIDDRQRARLAHQPHARRVRRDPRRDHLEHDS